MIKELPRRCSRNETRRFQDRHCSETPRRTTDANRLLNVEFARGGIMRGKITRLAHANTQWTIYRNANLVLHFNIAVVNYLPYILSMAAIESRPCDCVL